MYINIYIYMYSYIYTHTDLYVKTHLHTYTYTSSLNSFEEGAIPPLEGVRLSHANTLPIYYHFHTAKLRCSFASRAPTCVLQCVAVCFSVL